MTTRLTRGGESTTKLGLAVDWLRRCLADGPRPASDVKEAAREVGIESRTLRRAKELLGVEYVLNQTDLLVDRFENTTGSGPRTAYLDTRRRQAERRQRPMLKVHVAERLWKLHGDARKPVRGG
jgi:hypothetical protein